MTVISIRTVLLGLVIAGSLAAQKGPSERYVERVKPRATQTATDTTAAPVNYEIFRNVSIPAGKVVNLDSTLDYTNASSVAVTVRCTTCDSAANTLSNISLQAFWTVPTADVYSLAESIDGTQFPFWDTGGSIFQTFGTQFRLTIVNNDKQGILIQQVVFLRRP